MVQETNYFYFSHSVKIMAFCTFHDLLWERGFHELISEHYWFLFHLEYFCVCDRVLRKQIISTLQYGCFCVYLWCPQLDQELLRAGDMSEAPTNPPRELTQRHRDGTWQTLMTLTCFLATALQLFMFWEKGIFEFCFCYLLVVWYWESYIQISEPPFWNYLFWKMLHICNSGGQSNPTVPTTLLK